MKRAFIAAAILSILISLPGSLTAFPGHESPHEAFAWIQGGSFLGVHIEEVDSKSAKELNLKYEAGALVSKVVEKSPAEKAGVEEKDVVIRWNMTPVESAKQLRRLVGDTPSGRVVKLAVIRNGREKVLSVELEEASGSHGKEFSFMFDGEDMDLPFDHEKIHELIGGDGELEKIIMKKVQMGGDHGMLFLTGKPRLGVHLQPLTGQLADYFGLHGRKGVLVTEIVEESPAEKAGMKAGDIILSIGGEETPDHDSVVSILAEKEEGKVKIQILREKKEMKITAHLEKAEMGKFPHAEKRIELRVIAPGDGEPVKIETFEGGSPEKVIIKKISNEKCREI